jgi:putative FmdB family regulatory protein
MPNYDYQCESHECARIVEAQREIDKRHEAPRCPHCGACTYLRVTPCPFTVKGGTPKFHP